MFLNRALMQIFVLIGCLSIALPAAAQEQQQQERKGVETMAQMRQQLHSADRFRNAAHPKMKLADMSGEITQGEYVIVDLTGSITRSPCPYTCEDRGLPAQHCRAWQSASDPEECYLQDTRIPSDAFPAIDNDKTASLPAADARGRMSADRESRTTDIIYQRRVYLGEGAQSELVRNASETLSSMKSEIPAALVREANCLAVFPAVHRAAAVVGGRSGDGVVTCRGEAGKWSALGFVDIVGASVGAQLGAERSELVLLFMNDNAQRKLENGQTAFGTDLSFALGTEDSADRAGTNLADVVAFARSAGTFVSAALDGVRIDIDEEDLREFYSENARFESVTRATYVGPDHPVIVQEFVQLMSAEDAG